MATTFAVSGKGGTGKTTAAALIIRSLRNRREGPILALDADPDANLATVLGIKVEKTIGDLREETLEQMKNFPAGMSKDSYIEAGLHQLIVETEGVDLITMGRAEGPGCYCFINNLLRKFGDDIKGAYRWVVVDCEAGIEHLSRRTASDVDNLIVVVNDSPLSLDCARRIDEVTREIKTQVRRKYVLANAVKGDRIKAVEDRVSALGMTYLGALPWDARLDEIVFGGGSLYGLGDGPAVRKMDEMLKIILGGR